MAFKILKLKKEVSEFIEQVIEEADRNKVAFGFLPRDAYWGFAEKESIWVVVDSAGQYCGHLIFGGKHPQLKISQLYCLSKVRGKGVAQSLIGSLEDFAEKNAYNIITARVAADLSANIAWERMGYEIISQVAGGATTDRLINIRAKLITSNDLFDTLKPDQSDFHTGWLTNHGMPSIRALRYALDVNVVIDFLRRSREFQESEQIFKSALAGNLLLCVTPIFKSELDKPTCSGERDDLRSLVNNLQTLEEVPNAEIEALSEELRKIVMPDRSLERAGHENDEYDLRHLAYCIRHSVPVFITREKKLLSGRQRLRDLYNLDVLSPSDLILEVKALDTVHLLSDSSTLVIKGITREHESDVNKFLESTLDPSRFRDQFWSSIAIGCSRLVARLNNEIVGIAAWQNQPTNERNLNSLIIVDESSSASTKVIDHFLEGLLHSSTGTMPFMLNLSVDVKQQKTIETATKVGFQLNEKGNQKVLSKICAGTILHKGNWSDFIGSLKIWFQIEATNKLPKKSEFTNTGVLLNGKAVKLDTFETLFGPTLVLCPGREGIIVPIRSGYSSNLFHHQQSSLFERYEAKLRVERAYFRSPTGMESFKPGMPIIFYESGDKGDLVCHGRIRFTDRIRVSEAVVRFKRQGVLDENELNETARKGYIHVVTFDNVMPIRRHVSFSDIERLGCCNEANLVAPYLLSPEKMKKLFSFIYGI